MVLLANSTVYIGIVTYNSATTLDKCLRSLYKQSYPHWKVIVWDNASTDDSLAIAAGYVLPENIIQHPANIGFGRAHNSIIQQYDFAPHDFYMPLNPDVQLCPTYLEKLVYFMRETQCGSASGKILLLENSNYFMDSNTIYSAGHGLLKQGYAFNIGYQMESTALDETPREVFGIPGTAPLYRYEMMQSISLADAFFDEDMFMYYEDVDVDWRARRQGWQCWVVLDAIAYHHSTQLSEHLRVHSLANRYLSIIKNAFLFDLISVNIPIMIVHIMGRLILTPRFGIMFLWLILKNSRRMWRKRQRSQVDYKSMQVWYQWSRQQLTNQPLTLLDRLQNFGQCYLKCKLKNIF